MANRRGLYCGSFDPVTVGHIDVLKRAADSFDEICVSVGRNPGKIARYDFDQRMQMWRIVLDELSMPQLSLVECRDRADLPLPLQTIGLAKAHGCTTIIRGIRDEKDYLCETAYKQDLLATARSENCDIDFMWVYGQSSQLIVSSTLVAEKIAQDHLEEAELLLSPGVYQYLDRLRA